MLFVNANYALADDIYTIQHVYEAPPSSLGNIYAIQAELGVAYALNDLNTISTYYRENTGDYIFRERFSIPSTSSSSVSALIIVDNFLVVLSNSSVHFYNINAQAGVSFVKTVEVIDQMPSGTSLSGFLTNAGLGRYAIHSSDYIHLFEINAGTQLFTVLDSIRLLGDDENSSRTVSHLQYHASDNSLWVTKNTDALYRFERYDLSDQSINMTHQYNYIFGPEFDAVNEASILYARHDISANSVLVQSDRRTFIFQLNDVNQSVNLVYNELRGDDDFLAGSPTSSEQLVAINDIIHLTNVDWPNFQLINTNTNIPRQYATYEFFSSNDVVGQITSTGVTELFSLQQGVLDSTNIRFKSLLADAFPNRIIDSLFDSQSDRILILGTSLQEDNAPRLYVWQYNSDDNSAGFVTSALTLGTDTDHRFINLNIIGTYGDFIYVNGNSNLSIESEISVFHLLDGELQKLQDFDWPGLPGILVQSHAFVEPNKIAFFTYFRNTSAFTVRFCDIQETGLIGDCVDQTLFDNPIFSTFSGSFEFTKLKETNQFLLAPKSTIFKDSDREVSTWFFKYNGETEHLEMFQTLEHPSDDRSFMGLEAAFTYQQGTKLSFIYDGATGFLAWNEATGQWDLSDIQPNTRLLTAPMPTSNNTYFINEDDGFAYLLDLEDESFYRSDQRKSLGDTNSIYQITDGNKGYIIGVDRVAQLTTFELVDTSPVYFKRNFMLGSIQAVQDIRFDIDFREYFLNLDNTSLELYLGGGGSIESLLPSVTWDGIVLSGTLNNEDMFEGESSAELAGSIPIRIELVGRTLDNFSIVPVNVNDAPVLIEQLAVQNLIPGQAYEGNLGLIVVDPDREVVRFTYTSIPAGMTFTEDGSIQGSIATIGRYTIGVTATDPNGASLKFDINLVVTNATPRLPDSGGAESSGGGSVSLFSLLLMLTCFCCRKSKCESVLDIRESHR